MVYCDNYMTVVIEQIAEVGHNGQDSLYITHRSGVRNQTVYRTPEEVAQAYSLISNMIVSLNTGKSIAQHATDGTTVSPAMGDPEGPTDGAQGGLSLVKEPPPS